MARARPLAPSTISTASSSVSVLFSKSAREAEPVILGGARQRASCSPRSVFTTRYGRPAVDRIHRLNSGANRLQRQRDIWSRRTSPSPLRKLVGAGWLATCAPGYLLPPDRSARMSTSWRSSQRLARRGERCSSPRQMPTPRSRPRHAHGRVVSSAGPLCSYQSSLSSLFREGGDRAPGRSRPDWPRRRGIEAELETRRGGTVGRRNARKPSRGAPLREPASWPHPCPPSTPSRAGRRTPSRRTALPA